MESERDNVDKIKKAAMRGEWHQVTEIYKKDPRIHKAKITRSGRTALHVAASDAQEEVVEKLMKTIREKQKLDVLKIGDKQGNTPLHIAARLGSVSMCRFIAAADLKLIGVRNLDGETPLFLAVVHGHKGVFLFLNDSISPSENGYAYCRRKDGETILHCAIFGDYFDLAFQIIRRYEHLVNFLNEQGQSPLHVLATKPDAFRSGSQFRLCDRILYHDIFIEELREETTYSQSDHIKTDEKKIDYPPNYETCINFIKLIKRTVKVLSGTGEITEKIPNQRDTENPQVSNNIGTKEKEQNQGDAKNSQGEGSSRNNGAEGHQLFPPNYGICFEFVKLVSKATLIILGFGSTKIKKIREKKQKHIWSVQVLDELLQHSSQYEYEDEGRKPSVLLKEEDETIVDKQPVTSQDLRQTQNNGKNFQDKNGEEIKESNIPERAQRETPILIAAKNGITELVERILDVFPEAIHDMNSEKKNIVLLAVENRQPQVYQLLLKRTMHGVGENAFYNVDCNGNSALHLAATLGEHNPWSVAGPALQMQWEIKWFEFVRQSMPKHFFNYYNKKNMSPYDVFEETHRKLIETGDNWLTKTSESCSLVSTLIATVAFASSTAVPGGLKEESGEPNFENHPAFIVLAVSSLFALGFSVAAVVMFLAILTRFEKLFPNNLHKQLFVGLTSLFISIASMLVTFCAGHFITFGEKLKISALPVYALTCLPLTLFVIAQFPLYVALFSAIFKKEPYPTMPTSTKYKPSLR